MCLRWILDRCWCWVCVCRPMPKLPQDMQHSIHQISQAVRLFLPLLLATFRARTFCYCYWPHSTGSASLNGGACRVSEAVCWGISFDNQWILGFGEGGMPHQVSSLLSVGSEGVSTSIAAEHDDSVSVSFIQLFVMLHELMLLRILLRINR